MGLKNHLLLFSVKTGGGVKIENRRVSLVGLKLGKPSSSSLFRLESNCIQSMQDQRDYFSLPSPSLPFPKLPEVPMNFRIRHDLQE